MEKIVLKEDGLRHKNVVIKMGLWRAKMRKECFMTILAIAGIAILMGMAGYPFTESAQAHEKQNFEIVADGYSASVYVNLDYVSCSFAWDERGQLYVACLGRDITGPVIRGQHGAPPVLFRERCSGVAVADGYIFTATDFGGQLFKISISDGEADPSWNYNYPYGGDRDPAGMLIAPGGFKGPNVRPGDLLVQDRDYPAYRSNAIFVFPTSWGEGKVLIGEHDLLDECAAMSFGPEGYLYTISNAGLWKMTLKGTPRS